MDAQRTLNVLRSNRKGRDTLALGDTVYDAAQASVEQFVGYPYWEIGIEEAD